MADSGSGSGADFTQDFDYFDEGPPAAPPDDWSPEDGDQGGGPGEPPAPPPGERAFLVGPSMLPLGGVNLLGGAPHAGKSGLVAQLISQFLRPDPLFLPSLEFASLQPAEIAVVFTDRCWSENDFWFQKLGLEVPHLAIPEHPGAIAQMSRVLPASQVPGVELLRYCLDQLPPTVKLLVCDVFTNAFVGNLFHPAVVHRHMVGTQYLLRERQVCLLGTCYGNKLLAGKNERFRRPVDRIIGAAPFRGSASSMLFLEAAEETDLDYQSLSWYTRYGKERRFALSRDARGLFVERRDVVLESERRDEERVLLPEASRKKRSGGRRPDPAVAAAILSELAPGMPLARPELASRLERADIARATAYRAIKRLVEAGQLVWDDEAGTIALAQVPPAGGQGNP